MQDLAADIAQKSQGVFLWSRFAIFELIDGLTRGETLNSAALRQRLGQVPRSYRISIRESSRRSSQNAKETAGLVLLLLCSVIGLGGQGKGVH